MMVTLMLTGLKLLSHQLARMKLDEKENIVSRFLISTISTIFLHCYNIYRVQVPGRLQADVDQ